MPARISVIIPVYNSERYLERCLKSVFAQTYNDYEIIAVNDGSTDSSAEILEDMAASHPDKLHIEHQENAGAAIARNRGIELANGEYICFVDNDDYIDPDYLHTLAQAAEGSVDIIFSGFRRPDANGRTRHVTTLDPNREWAPFAVQAPWSKLFRTDFIRQNELSFLATNINEDLHFTLPAIACSQTRIVIPYCGYNWFFNEESVSNTVQKSSIGLEFDKALRAIVDELERAVGELDGLYLHSVVRLVAWFLLYTGGGDRRSVRQANYTRLTSWLDNRIPRWRSDPYARVGAPSGDSREGTVSTWLFAKHPLAFKAALHIHSQLA